MRLGEKMKINRLLEITILLLNKKKTTASVLAERFGVSTRTIYRDIDVLSSAGVPVYTNKGKGGGICLLDDYYIGGATVKADEVDGLNAALQTLKAAKYPDVDAVINKLGAVFKGKTASASWVEIDLTPWGTDPNLDGRFKCIKDAILSHYTITFDYVSSNGSDSEREAEPYVLWYKGSGWYLMAYCLKRKDFRLFRMTRMHAVSITENRFEPRELTDESWSSEGAKLKQINLRFRFTPGIRYRIYDEFDRAFIKSEPDGSGIVTVTMPGGDWLYGYIMSYGADVEILSPESFRQDMIMRIDALRTNYR